MRLVTYANRGQPQSKPRLGVEFGCMIVDVQAACVAYAMRHDGPAGAETALAVVPSDMRTFIRRYPLLRKQIEPALRMAADALARVDGAEALELVAAGSPVAVPRADVRLLAPLLDPPKIVCVGLIIEITPSKPAWPSRRVRCCSRNIPQRSLALTKPWSIRDRN